MLAYYPHPLSALSKIKGWEENCSQLQTVCGIQIHIIAVFSYIWKTKGMQAFIETHIW